MKQSQNFDVAIIGGGLAGLTAAGFLSRAGKRVILFEKAHEAGGRAATHVSQGFHFNLGPHALYQAGAGHRILSELGIKFSGRRPDIAGAYVVDKGVKHTFPAGFFSLLTTSVFGLHSKIEVARLLANISNIETAPIQNQTLNEWLDHNIKQPDTKRFLKTIVRVSTYGNDAERQSAGAALAQVQMGLTSGVLYLDGGWQTLIDGLRKLAESHGAQISTSAKVQAIETTQPQHMIHLSDDTVIHASSTIIATGPSEAAEIVNRGDIGILNEWAKAAIPVRMASLDLALKRAPEPQAIFALGIDSPLYFSMHSATARLAPEGGAVIHAAKYLGSDSPTDPRRIETELENLTDLIQPGWRDLVVNRRFLPKLTVSHGLVTAAQGGLAGRPGPEVPGIDNLFVAGDWVGPEGQLADASFASARLAAEIILRKENYRSAAA